jgi:hypothetical protein
VYGINKPFKFNEAGNNKNTTSTTCSPGAGPDGVALFKATKAGFVRAQLKSSVRGSGRTLLSFRIACSNEDSASNKLACGESCATGTESSCKTVCTNENEVLCKEMTGSDKAPENYIEIYVEEGVLVMLVWDQTTDDAKGLVEIDMSLTPL